MKKVIMVLLLMTGVLVWATACAQDCIIDKTQNEHAEFSFDADAKILEVYFPKIYGCDAAFVRFGEHTMLIDCAGEQWREVRAMLESLGVQEIEYALNSHPDRDHIGGFDRIIGKTPAKEFLLGFPEDYDSGDRERFVVYDALHEMGIPFRQVKHGDQIHFGDVQIDVLQRTDEHLPRVNNKSVMLLIRYGERSFYFTGDIQRDAQNLLAEAVNAGQVELKADIMKFPHHGYANMQDSFLDAVSPQLVICTAGQTNTDGTKQLKDRKIAYMMTMRGGIKLTTDGKVWCAERFDY